MSLMIINCQLYRKNTACECKISSPRHCPLKKMELMAVANKLHDLNNDCVHSRRLLAGVAAEQLINIFRDAKWRAGCGAESGEARIIQQQSVEGPAAACRSRVLPLWQRCRIRQPALQNRRSLDLQNHTNDIQAEHREPHTHTRALPGEKGLGGKVGNRRRRRQQRFLCSGIFLASSLFRSIRATCI
jgi:hypothetical protein